MPHRNSTLSELIERVRLADAYQHIGKAEYGDSWVDHEIGIFTQQHGIKIASLAGTKFIQPRQKQLIEPQYQRLAGATFTQVPINDGDEASIIRHNAMIQFLEKLIINNELTLYLKSGAKQILFSELRGLDTAHVSFDYLASTVSVTKADKSKEIYDVLVSASKLKKTITSLAESRRKRAKNNPNAGRKYNSDSKALDDIIIAFVKTHPSTRAVKELATLVQPVLAAQGHSLSVGAIEKRISRKKLMSAN